MRRSISAVMAVVASVLLLQTGVGLLVFTLPLFLASASEEKKGSAVLLFVATALGVIGSDIYLYKDLFFNSQYMGVFFLEILFPLISLAVGAVWVGLRDFSDSVLRKMVISSSAALVLGLAFTFYLSSPIGEAAQSGLTSYLAGSFGYLDEVLGLGISDMVPFLLIGIKLGCVPCGMIFAGLPILIAENGMHKRDENWQLGFAYMKMPNSFIWVFFLAWAGVLASLKIDLPSFAVIACWNVALTLSLHYMLGGMSILTSIIRRQSATLTAGRVLLISILLMLIPGVGIIVFIALALAGVLETWIKLR